MSSIDSNELKSSYGDHHKNENQYGYTHLRLEEEGALDAEWVLMNTCICVDDEVRDNPLIQVSSMYVSACMCSIIFQSCFTSGSSHRRDMPHTLRSVGRDSHVWSNPFGSALSREETRGRTESRFALHRGRVERRGVRRAVGELCNVPTKV